MRGPTGAFDAIKSFEMTYRLYEYNGFAIGEYAFLYRHKVNPRFLGARFNARNVRFAQVLRTPLTSSYDKRVLLSAVIPQWVAVEARVRFFDAAGKQDGTATIDMLGEQLQRAGTWSQNRHKRVTPWAKLFRNVKTTRTISGVLPSDPTYAGKLNRLLLQGSSRIVIDRPRLVHVHYGPNVWQAFAAATWRGQRKRLKNIPGKRFWDADPVATAPTSEPDDKAHQRATATQAATMLLYNLSGLSTYSALRLYSPANGSVVRTKQVMVRGVVSGVWTHLTKRVQITVNGHTTTVVPHRSGHFSTQVNVHRGSNRIDVRLEGPVQNITRTVTVSMYEKPRQTMYWVCMQSFSEKYKSYRNRWTQTFASRVFVTYQTQSYERAQVQAAWQKYVFDRYLRPGWRPYSGTCSGYINATYARNAERSYLRMAQPNSTEQYRYRRQPGAVINFQYKEK